MLKRTVNGVTVELSIADSRNICRNPIYCYYAVNVWEKKRPHVPSELGITICKAKYELLTQFLEGSNDKKPLTIGGDYFHETVKRVKRQLTTSILYWNNDEYEDCLRHLKATRDKINSLIEGIDDGNNEQGKSETPR